MWITDHRRDLVADFRSIYHLGWAEAVGLPSWEFLALAYRASVYPGTIAARVAENERRERRNVRKPGARLVDGDQRSIQTDSLLSDVIDFG